MTYNLDEGRAVASCAIGLLAQAQSHCAISSAPVAREKAQILRMRKHRALARRTLVDDPR